MVEYTNKNINPIADAVREVIKLHPKQQEAVDEIRSIRGPVWLRGDTGCGKTYTSIAAMLQDYGDAKDFDGIGLTVCPEANLMEKWQHELANMGIESYILGKMKDVEGFYEAVERGVRWFIVSYGCLSFRRKSKKKPERAGDALASLCGQITHVIFDESQKCKDAGTKRVRNWIKFIKANFTQVIADGKERRILMLSATPLIKEDLDLINQYKVVGLENEITHIIEYEDKVIRNRTGQVVAKVTLPVKWKPDEALLPLKVTVEGVLEQRRVTMRQEDIFPSDLPPMKLISEGIDLGSPDDLHGMLMDEACKDEDSDELRSLWARVLRLSIKGELGPDFWHAIGNIVPYLRAERGLKSTPDSMPLMIWNIFKRAEGRLIAPQVAGVVRRWLEKGEDVVVFANNKPPLHTIYDALKDDYDVRYFTGDQSPKQLKENKEAFQHGNARVLLSTYLKGGIGVEFTPAKVAVLAQRSPSPADAEQAKARIYRMNSHGQTYAITCEGELEGDATRLEESLTRIIDNKKYAANRAGLGGSLG